MIQRHFGSSITTALLAFQRLASLRLTKKDGIISIRSSLVHRHASTTTQRSKEVSPKLDKLILQAKNQVKSVDKPQVSRVQLRNYQQEAITSCLSALSRGLTRIGVSSPTGSGKTTMFMHLIPSIIGQKDDKGKGQALILVSSVELVNQAEGAAKRILGKEYSIEVEQSKRHASGLADITIATYQTLNSIDRLKKFDPAKFKAVIVDEAHHAAALSYMKILQYFNDGVELPSTLIPVTKHNHGYSVPIIGFSATFSRPDQLALSAVFEEIVFHKEVSSMLRDGWLSPAKSTAVKCNLDLENVEVTPSGDFNTNSLAHHINTPLINDLIVRTYLHRANDRRSTLVFCVDLNHVSALTKQFREAGIDARSISSLSPLHARKETLAGFSNGEFPVLINCEVLTEGTDIPQIDCIILARPTRSKNLLAQMVGRGLRLSPETGKEDCYIIDIVDNVSRSNGMLVSPTLWGLSHDDLEVDGNETDFETKSRITHGKSDLTQLETSDVGGEEPPLSLKKGRVTFIDQGDPFQLHNKEFQPLSTMSSNAWVACGDNRYILEMLNIGYLLVAESETPEEGKWTITFRRKMLMRFGGSAFFARVQTIAHADDLERAIQTSDKYAERRVGRTLYSKLSRYASWRQRSPTQKAINMMLKMKGAVAEGGDGKKSIRLFGKNVELSKLTAGQVSAYLCAANHGALSIQNKAESKMLRAKKRKESQDLKEKQLAERNLPFPVDSTSINAEHGKTAES